MPIIFGCKRYVLRSAKMTRNVLDENSTSTVLAERSRLTFWINTLLENPFLTFWMKCHSKLIRLEFGQKSHVLRFWMKMSRLTFLDENVTSYVFWMKMSRLRFFFRLKKVVRRTF